MNANLPALQRGSHAGKHAFRSATEVFLARLKASAATPLADSSAESEKCIKYMKALHNCLLYTARCGQAGCSLSVAEISGSYQLLKVLPTT